MDAVQVFSGCVINRRRRTTDGGGPGTDSSASRRVADIFYFDQVKTEGPPSPCFCHEYQNKGVRPVNLVMNIKTKDLARTKRIGEQVVCFYILTRCHKFMDSLARQ
jgi:hypothetical protein